MARRKERDAVVFLNEQMKMVGIVLSEWERGRLFEQLRAYAIEGKTPDLTGESEIYRAIYDMMRAAQDKAIEQYNETCERNRVKALKRVQQDAATAADGSCGSQSNQIKSNQIKSNIIESNLSKINRSKPREETLPSLKGQEIEGVPGVVWG